jgi:rhodanese-related sulfurtransferase
MANRKKQQKNNRNMMVGLAGVFLLAITVTAVLSNPAASAPSQMSGLPFEISVQEAFSLREQDTLILDVRTPDEWNDGHVPGATLIPLDELETRLAELPQEDDIVVICRSGNRSATARDILLNAGFSSVTSVAGGFNDWVANGYAVETGP